MNKKKIVVPYNFNLDSIIKPKSNNISNIISPIPISISKKKYQNSVNFRKKESIADKLFFSFFKNKSNKTNLNNFSMSKEKSKKDNSNEFINQNDNNNLKKKCEIIKIEIDMVNKMLNDNKKNIENLMKELNNLNLIKGNKQKELENNLSQKETLDEMSKTILKSIKSSYSNINENFFIEISLDEITNNNKESFTNRVYKVFNYINNNYDPTYFNFIKDIINQAYIDLFYDLTNKKNFNATNSIKNFFLGISLRISNEVVPRPPDKAINIMVQLLLKINIISENIDKIIHFLKYELMEQKNKINTKINDFEKKSISLQNKKNELLDLQNKIKEKIELFSQKKTPFCEKTINHKKLNKNNLNKNSSGIHFSTECMNKSNSNSIDKGFFTATSHKKENNNSNQRKKLYRNMMKFFNSQNNTKDYSAYHSNKISEGKIYISGISGNSSSQKNKKNSKKIKLKDINKKIKIIGWTQKKEVKLPEKISSNKNKIQNGQNNDVRERNNQLIKELTKVKNLTDFEGNYNLTQINQSNMKNNRQYDNGKSVNDISKIKPKEFNLFIDNKFIKNTNTKTERDIEYENLTHITSNTKSIEKSFLNDNLKPIFKNEKYKLTKIFSLYENASFEKKKAIKSFNNGNNHLNKYLTKKEDYKCINKSNNIIHYHKIKKNINNFSRIKSKTLNENITNRNQKKKSYNSSQKSDINIKNNKSIYYNNSMESFCYYKLLENDSQMFNPLNNNINFNKLGYNEGFISIDTISNCIKIHSNKIISNNNGNKKDLDLLYINNFENSNNFSKSEFVSNMSKANSLDIPLKEIIKIYLNKIMKNIVKIHNIFLKYNIINNNENDNGISSKKVSNINKLLNVREIMNIKDMEQSEKIKAGLCNFFSFIIEFGNNNKLECILINYVLFNNWFNYLEDIANNNIKSKKSISNGNSSGIKNKRNGIYKLKSLYSKLGNRKKERFHRSITEKKEQIKYENL